MLTRSRLGALVLSALSTPTLAQTPPCLASNDQNTANSGAITGFAFAGPTSLAWQFTPAQNVTIEAAQLYTRNQFFAQDMTLEIWSDNGNSLPLSRLAGGAWKIVRTALADWQGANLDAAVPLGQGIPYWLVWTEPGNSLVPVEPGGSALTSARLPSGGAWTTRAADAPKFRLFCNQLDAFNVAPRGASCQGSLGLGTAHTNQAPTVGNADFSIDGSGFRAAAPAVLVVGFQPSWVSFPLPGGPLGSFLHVEPFLVTPGVTGSGNVRAASGSNGHAFFSLPIPGVPQLVGLIMDVQVAALDVTLSVPLPLVTSNGLRLVIY